MSGAEVDRPEKRAAAGAIASAGDGLVALSHRIHAHPELCFAETSSSRWCAERLEAAGYEVTAGICGLETAFSAALGEGPLTIGICCEYDALPEIGHACGHNVIAAAAVGAAVGLAGLADELGVRVVVLGTPAEEGGGGKILMLDRGGFDGVHAALMVHPWPVELIEMPCLAVSHLRIAYEGVEAHASAFPEAGRNAADAITVAQVAIGLLRQHARANDQVHGIVTKGGAAPNIVPAHTEAEYFVRAPTLERLAEWEPRVRRCFEAGAIATETSLTVSEVAPAYSEFVTDPVMAASYRANAEALGRSFVEPAGRMATASTDMANVSRAMPAIHPTLGIDSLPATNHQAAFAAHCVTATADKALVEGATAMAWTVIDLALGETERSGLLARRQPAGPGGS